MNDDDSQSGLAKKRTARVQLTNGALEARAYVGPTAVPVEEPHKTIEMRTVAVDESLDPRRQVTVARGFGAALGTLEGDIIDPTTGQILPPVDPHAIPNTPWAQGKRPTSLKGVAPALVRPPSAGAASSVASQPGYGAYIAAGSLVLAALVGAVVIVSSEGPGAPASATAAPRLAPEAARPVETAATPLSPGTAPASAPAAAPGTALPASGAASASAAPPLDPTTPRQAPIPQGSPGTPGTPSGKGTSPRPPASAPKPGDRLF